MAGPQQETSHGMKKVLWRQIQTAISRIIINKKDIVEIKPPTNNMSIYFKRHTQEAIEHCGILGTTI